VIPKLKPYRSRKWLSAVGQIECCVLCGGYGTQVAHRNEGKGMSQKVDDCLTAATCLDCHHAIDNGPGLTREQRRAEMDRAIVMTLRELVTRGQLRLMN
jgi:hypothetical protein